MKIYGVHPIEELLKTSPSSVRSVSATRWEASELEEVRRLCKEHEISTIEITEISLERLADGINHQGIVCETGPFDYLELDELLERTADDSSALVVVLDQIQDPHNLGAILRSAAAFDVAAVIISKDRAASVTPAVVRASAGLAFRVPVVQVTNIARTLSTLKDEGWWSVGTFMDGNTDVWDLDFDMKAAVVLGGEHQGIRRLVGEHCDFRCRIPCDGAVESLNVSVAGAILMFESYRHRVSNS